MESRLRFVLSRPRSVLRDFYGYFWAFQRKVRTNRGVFESFRAAAASCPTGKRLGYDQHVVAHSNPVNLTSPEEIGRFDPRDYPVLVWLARAFEDGTTVFDLGGHVGLGYYAYRPFIHYPRSLRWVVCEIPPVCVAGRQFAAEREAPGLEFTEDYNRCEGADILLTCGALQFLEFPLAHLLSGLRRKPKHLILHRVPLGDVPTFYTLQNIGYSYCPYRVQNKQELLNSLAAQGYQLVDSWRDSKEFRIPFHPRQTVNGFQGIYLRLR